MGLIADWTEQKLREGFEFVWGNRLRIWHTEHGWKADRYLTDADRAFMDINRRELAAFVRAGLQPRFPDENAPAPAPQPQPAPNVCRYCGRPCVGPDDRWYAVYHWNDPAEAERRHTEAHRREQATRRLWQQAGIQRPHY